MIRPSSLSYPAAVCVDLDAVAANARRMQQYAGDATFLAVVKANAYGMGRTAVAERLWDEGIRWFATARVPEAIALRRALTEHGADPEETHILTWLNTPEGDWSAALQHQLDISVSNKEQLSQVVATVEALRESPREGTNADATPARIHLKVDTGMSRGGATPEELPALAKAVKVAEDQGAVELIGLWSHLAMADDPGEAGQAFTAHQVERFEQAYEVVQSAGLHPQIRHLSATAGTIWHPEAHYDMVRVGIGLYGLSPDPSVASSSELGLTPVGALRTRITLTKRLAPGDTVSYGGTWVAPDHHWVGILPVGYQDGISRALSNCGTVAVQTAEGLVPAQILGRICMDQTIIDLGNGEEPLAPAGSVVTFFGDPARGEPSVDQWAEKAGTINYEVISRIPLHLERTFLSSSTEEVARD